MESTIKLVSEKTFHVHLFDGIPEDIKQQLELIAKTKVYSKGTVIFNDSLLNESFFYINSGLVKLYKETSNGNEFIIDIMGPKTYFGESLLFEESINTRKHFCSAQTLSETQVVILPIKVIQKLILQNSQFMINLIKSFSVLHEQRALKSKHISCKTAVELIGCFLLKECPNDNKNSVIIKLPYDKSIISSQLHMQPETFSRALAKLSAQENIRIENDTIYIPSVKALNDSICATCSLQFPCNDSFQQ